MDDKVYAPEVIQENPFPNQDISSVTTTATQTTAGGVTTPTVAKEKSLPIKRTAVELLSSALNTRSKKILQDFEFGQSGSIQIGNFEEGQTGDLRLTPNGLTARDKAGITTFAIDGDTGDAIFKGQLKSGSVVTGNVIVGNNRVIIQVDDNGNGSIIVNDGTNDRVLIGYQSGGF